MTFATGDQFRALARKNIVASSDATGDAVVDKIVSRKYLKAYVATNVAGATFALPLDIVPVRFIVDNVKVIPSAALTASDSVYATLTLSVDDGAGGSKTTVAVQTTKIAASGGTGDWVAEIGVPLTITAANATVAAGAQLTLSKAYASTGTVIPAGSLVIVEGYYV